MNIKEKHLASKMLNLAADEFSNHGCNDLDSSLFKDWSEEEIKQFLREFYIWNTHKEPFLREFYKWKTHEEPSDEELKLSFIRDDGLMDFLAYKLKNE